MNMLGLRPLLSGASTCWLLLLSLIVCVWRIRYFHEPLENDLTLRMAYAARALSGYQYYSDLFAFGPVGTLWVNEIFISLAGMNNLAIYAMGCTFAVLTLFGVNRVVFHLVGNPGAMVASLVWVFISSDLFTQANQPNSEVIINAAMVWAFALVLAGGQQKGFWHAIGAGLLFFLASTIKHFTLVVPAMAFLAYALLHRDDASRWRPFRLNKEAWRSWLVAGGMIVCLWMIMVVWYWLSGRLAAFTEAMVGTSIKYAAMSNDSGFAANLIKGMRPAWLVPWHQRPFGPFYLALAGVVVAGVLKVRESSWAILAGWMAGTWLSVSMSGRFYPHYYMLWLPLLAIGSGSLFGLLKAYWHSRWGYALQLILLASIIGVSVRQISQLVRYDADEAVIAKYNWSEPTGSVFTETRNVGQKIANLPEVASVFELGASGLYFYAKRPAPMPYVDSLYGVDKQMDAEKYVAATQQYLDAQPPDLLIINKSYLSHGASFRVAQFAQELVSSGAYHEDKELSGTYLIVFRREKAAP